MCARQRTYFLCFAKESRQRKATPLPVSLRCAAGNLRCSRQAGSARNSLHCVSLKQRAALFRLALRFSAQAQGDWAAIQGWADGQRGKVVWVCANFRQKYGIKALILLIFESSGLA
jgi:hypothetical protein